MPADYHQKAFDGLAAIAAIDWGAGRSPAFQINLKEDSYVCESSCNNNWYIAHSNDNQIYIYGQPDNFSCRKSIYYLELYYTCLYVGIR